MKFREVLWVVRGRGVDETGSGSWPMAGFGITIVQPFQPVTREVVGYLIFL
jgi:hypothetical protein